VLAVAALLELALELASGSPLFPCFSPIHQFFFPQPRHSFPHQSVHLLDDLFIYSEAQISCSLSDKSIHLC